MSRPTTGTGGTSRPTLLALALAVAATVLRLAAAPNVPINWDAAQLVWSCRWGYLLVVWPAVCLLLGDALLGFAGALAALLARSAGPARGVVVAAAVAANGAVFLATPNALSWDALRAERQFWRDLAALGEAFPPDRTVIVSGARASESFRQAMVLLPEYWIYAVGEDRSKRAGVLFTGRGDRSDYGAYLAGRPADGRLRAPPGTDRILVLDSSAARLIGATTSLARQRLGGGRDVFWGSSPLGDEAIELRCGRRCPDPVL